MTGGVTASFEKKSKLEKDLMQLSKDIHSRYLVSFVPDEPRRLISITSRYGSEITRMPS
jgi:hypothetical protein